MPGSIRELMRELEPDPWRKEQGFSPEIESTLNELESAPLDAQVEILNRWIANHQPCLFGRIAAKHSAITYGLISDAALDQQDERIEELIQDARLNWTRAGFDGLSSNFIIVLLSRRLATAVPNDVVKRIALRICSLYLQETVVPDRVYLDRLWLEQPGSPKRAWEWVTGVNYFSAQGDNRWWNDHRFPAGMAFSVNSVGHFVKSGKLANALQELDRAMGGHAADFTPAKIDTLEKALGMAMRTIGMASQTCSGKATYLLDRNPAVNPGSCPIKLAGPLAQKDFSTYEGFYHTDYTIPSEYFVPDVDRPTSALPFRLDFSYLYDRALDNPDFDRMGEGRRIRLAGVPSGASMGETDESAEKRKRGEPREVSASEIPRLNKAIGR